MTSSMTWPCSSFRVLFSRFVILLLHEDDNPLGERNMDNETLGVSLSLLIALGFFLIILILVPSICGGRCVKDKEE
jgi:hypothetical protein